MRLQTRRNGGKLLKSIYWNILDGIATFVGHHGCLEGRNRHDCNDDDNNSYDDDCTYSNDSNPPSTSTGRAIEGKCGDQSVGARLAISNRDLPTTSIRVVVQAHSDR